MFKKVTVIIDTVLRRRIEKDYDLRTSPGLAECFKLVPEIIKWTIFNYFDDYTGDQEALQKLLSPSNGEHEQLTGLITKASRIEVVLRLYVHDCICWKMNIYEKNSKRPRSLEFWVKIKTGKIAGGLTMSL